ncbi:MAG: hypothetical protein Q4E57_04950 [Eubacteriales bacterium]|nr:hypothetical protein [Eubacteriales bacterium]
MKNADWCAYTYRHRKAFEYTAEKLIKDPELKAKMLRRAKVHDMDKLLLYLFTDDQLEAQRIHVSHSAHHLENDLPRTYEDYVETVIDYECAPYTKPDKPLNAWDFANKLLRLGALKPETAEILFGIMHELGIDRSYLLTETDPEGIKYLDSIAGPGKVTEEMILLEVLKYVDETKDNALHGELQELGIIS